MENRTRPYAYTFRASENERKIIDEKLKASSLTMTDFIIKSITNKPIMIFENSGEILNELKRQGNNLNQLARANYCGLTTKRDILSCVDELKNTYKAITKAISANELRSRNNEKRQRFFVSASTEEKGNPRTTARDELYKKRGVKENWKTE